MYSDALSYEKLKDEFENYQISAEQELQKLSMRNMKLEKDINLMSNIVEISKYINASISDENLMLMINDMVVGLLGVAYSTIFLEEQKDHRKKYVVKATNVKDKVMKLTESEIEHIQQGEVYQINNKEGIRTYSPTEPPICSVLGMPIKLRNKSFGYILVEHHLFDFGNREHNTFLKAIANQIAIALENAVLYKELLDTAKKDPLLGIYNRRYFFELTQKNRRLNETEPYAIVMIDLDNFKHINDLYGHQFGDKVLIETTEVIKRHLKEKDILARYGGEELIICIYGFRYIRQVYNRVEFIRKCISRNLIREGYITKKMTASFGIAYYPADGRDINTVIKQADTLLYKAKKMGKNRVMCSEVRQDNRE